MAAQAEDGAGPTDDATLRPAEAARRPPTTARRCGSSRADRRSSAGCARSRSYWRGAHYRMRLLATFGLGIAHVVASSASAC